MFGTEINLNTNASDTLPVFRTLTYADVKLMHYLKYRNLDVPSKFKSNAVYITKDGMRLVTIRNKKVISIIKELVPIQPILPPPAVRHIVPKAPVIRPAPPAPVVKTIITPAPRSVPVTHIQTPKLSQAKVVSDLPALPPLKVKTTVLPTSVIQPILKKKNNIILLAVAVSGIGIMLLKKRK